MFKPHIQPRAPVKSDFQLELAHKAVPCLSDFLLSIAVEWSLPCLTLGWMLYLRRPEETRGRRKPQVYFCFPTSEGSGICPIHPE